MLKDDAKPHVLVVEDARDIASRLARYLPSASTATERRTAADAQVARKVMKGAAIDLVVLDIMMPGEGRPQPLPLHPRDLANSRRSSDGTWRGGSTASSGWKWGADDLNPKAVQPAGTGGAHRRGAPPHAGPAPPPETAGGRAHPFGDWTLDTGQRELIGTDGMATACSQRRVPPSQRAPNLIAPKIALNRTASRPDKGARAPQDFSTASIDNHVSGYEKKIEPDPKIPV